MLTEQEKTEQRILRKAKYAVEDFTDSTNLLTNIAIGHVIFAVVLGLGGLLGSKNFPHVLYSLATAGLLFAFHAKLKFLNKKEIFIGLGVYALVFLVELLSYGVPDNLLPFLNLKAGRRPGVLQLLNGLTPYVYLGCRLALGYVFIQILLKRNKLDEIPQKVLMKMNFRLE